MREIILILPNIRSCFNVGAMFRTADAMGVSKIYLVGYTPAPPDPRIDKVSLGAEKWLPFEQTTDLAELITKLKAEGFEIIALEKTANSHDISQAKFSEKLALIVGNEVDGVLPETLNECDQILHINMLGLKGSLNVSVATGIALFSLRHNK